MNRLLLLTLLVLALLLFTSTQAATQVRDDLIALGYGENATLNLEEFTRTSVRIYEGSKLRINVEDISLDIHITTIRDDGTSLLTINKNGGPPEAFTIVQGNQTAVRFESRIKAIFFEERVLHSSAKPEERNIQLYINIPLFYTKGELPEIPDQPPAEENSTTAQTNKPATSDPYLPYFFGAIGILIIAIILIKPSRKKKKSL